MRRRVGTLRRAAPWTVLLAACSAGNAAPPRTTAFDAARAWRDLETLVALGPRPPGSEALERARAYLELELGALGLEPVREAFTAQTPIGPIEMCNVYADLEAPAAEGERAPLVLLVAHFDTKICDFEFVGANDGGSGTAVLLELARVLAQGPERRLSYRFLFVDGEEAVRWDWAGEDNCYGSRHHAERLLRGEDYERTKAVVLIDLVGDRDLRLWRDSNSDPELLAIFFDAARENGLGRYVDGRREPVKDDHLSFMRIGVRSVDFIDLEYGPDNDWWHSPEDTLDKCSAESLGATGKIVLLGLPGLEALFAR